MQNGQPAGGALVAAFPPWLVKHQQHLPTLILTFILLFASIL